MGRKGNCSMKSAEHEKDGGPGLHTRRTVLVIGYGSTLRNDDGAGPAVAQRVAEWNLPGVTALAPVQLTPELAGDIAVHDLVLFVDAAPAAIYPAVSVSRVGYSAGDTAWGAIGHAGNPSNVMDTADCMYGRRPEAWQIAIPAVDLQMGEHLSAETAVHVEAALVEVRHLVARAMEPQEQSDA